MTGELNEGMGQIPAGHASRFVLLEYRISRGLIQASRRNRCQGSFGNDRKSVPEKRLAAEFTEDCILTPVKLWQKLPSPATRMDPAAIRSAVPGPVFTL